jgi:hypothetical protein
MYRKIRGCLFPLKQHFLTLDASWSGEMRLPYIGMETTDIISEQFLMMAGAFQELLPGIYPEKDG